MSQKQSSEPDEWRPDDIAFGERTEPDGPGETGVAPATSPLSTEQPRPVSCPDDTELKAILETLLFISQDPVSVDRLAAVVEGVPKAVIRQALSTLQQQYEEEGRALQLVEIAGGFQFTTRAEYAGWIRAFGKTKTSSKLSRSGLESLAIIAYKQPIVRAEIEAIRGVETSGVLRTLLERKLVRIVGRKDVPGRPIMYGTTKFFLQHFGLRDLSELPPLREFKELGDSEQVLLPVGDDPLQVGTGPPPDEHSVAEHHVTAFDSVDAP